MGNIGSLFRESSIPGLSTIFSKISKPRKFIVTIVFFLFVGLTVKDLIQISSEFLKFPITVSVLVADSRVLPFPAITVCNLNPVHRGRFCKANEAIKKPENVEKILCATLNDLLEVCKIGEILDELVTEGKEICSGKKQQTRGRPGASARRPTRAPVHSRAESNSSNESTPTRQGSRGRRPAPRPLRPPRPKPSVTRGKREAEFNLKTLINTVKAFSSGNLSGGIFDHFTEAGGIVDGLVLQVASLYGISANSTKELIPALFLRAFTEVTGCQVGQSEGENTTTTNPFNDALQNLTVIFSNANCIWKAPKLIKLFQKSSDKMLDKITSCTGPWVRGLLADQSHGSTGGSTDSRDETPWYVLLSLLQSFMADLTRNHPEEAKKIGHQKKNMIKSCYFAGKKCDIDKDFQQTFFSTHGNCFSYNLLDKDAENGGAKESLSGFTGPKFGLELLLDLETDQYMPTSRESGLKLVVHDRNQKADPDQDAINISPGVVTYVGVQLVNITRLPSPYHDKCITEWPEGQGKEWANNLNHDTYTTQMCLKICVQQKTLERCGCWSPSAPASSQVTELQCELRRNKVQAECVENIRQLYYKGAFVCNCPPRCLDLNYDKFVSTGQETRHCSAIPSDKDSEKSSADNKQNHAKLVVYYQSLSYNEIKQEKKYTAESLLGSIGGILGVYLGFSFLAIYEFFEVLIRGFFSRKAKATHGVSHEETKAKRAD